jgi:hypothetical protein
MKHISSSNQEIPILKEAQGGIYFVIGDGLRRLPELSVVNEPMDGVAAVVRGKSAYVDVSINNQRFKLLLIHSCSSNRGGLTWNN